MKNMFLKFIFILLSFSFLYGGTKTIKVSYDPDYAPFSYIIDDKPYGLFIDIWKEWAKVNNYKVKFINAKTWDNAIKLAKDGKVDYFLGTEAYEEWMEFSHPYYKIKTSLFKLKNNKNPIKTIGIIGEDYKQIIKKEFPDTTIKLYKTYKQLIDALISKKIDVIFDDRIAMNYYITLKQKQHLIHALNSFVTVSDVCAISNSYEKINIFNMGLYQIPKKRLQEIEANWLPNTSEAYYTQQNVVILTPLEKQWLKKHPISRIAVMSYWPHNTNGENLHTKVLELINKYAGTNLVYVQYDSWKDGFSKTIKGKDVDGIMGLSWSKDREKKYFYYTPAYNFTPCYLIAKKTSKVKDLSSIKNKTVYLKENSITHEMIKSRKLDVKIVDKTDMKQIYEALATSKTDDVALSYFVDEKQLEKYNLKVVKQIYDRYGEVSIGIHHKYPILASIINKAINAIPRETMADLRDRMDFKNKNKLKLTQKEQKYINKQHPIKYVYDNAWKPLEWKNGLEHHTGIVSDLLNIIKDRSGLNLVEIPSVTWKEAIEKVKSKEADMFSAIGETKERKKYLKFTTKKILTTPYVFVSRQGEDYINGFHATLGKKIAINNYSTIKGILEENKPNLNVILLDKTQENGFKQLQEGKIDIYIVNAIKARYYINALGYSNLKIAYKTKFNLDLKIAIRKDLPDELLTILDKSIASINDKELNDIFTKWTTIRVEETTDWIFILKIVGGIIIITLILLLSNYKLKAMVKEKTYELEQLNQEIEDTQKEVVFTMGSIGESRSKETGNHVKRVAQYSYILAKYYGLDEKECEMIKQASPMHDIGKVAIPDAILNKPARFTDEEREIMNTHAQLGYDMLKYSKRPLLKMAAIIAYEHHEKWDGTGYPNKLKGEDIHIYGRITALADVFDALGSARVYKPAWDDEKIFKMFKEERGKHFDPKLIDIFFKHLDEFLKAREEFSDI